MANPSLAVEKQQDFLSCYRGRQNVLHHASYTRMGKVLLALRVCREAGIELKGKTVFDYGFGAGTFFHYCDRSCQLHGVEMDSVNVNDVQDKLRGMGYSHTDLQTIEIENWSEHPLLDRSYDIILCSHVMEHMDDPVGFLRRIRPCLGSGGVFIGLVPINERKMDPHHVQVVDRETIESWARESGLQLSLYAEGDPWTYWCQPLFATTSRVNRFLTRAIALSLGVPATLVGPSAWHRLAGPFQGLTASLPTQAAFLLTPDGRTVTQAIASN